MTKPLYKYPDRDTFGPEAGNAVSRAAGKLGLAIRYGATEAEVEACRAEFETAKLERAILKAAGGLNRTQRARLVSAVKKAGA